MTEPRECIDSEYDDDDPCKGELEDYYSAHGTHTVRCEHHMTQHFEKIEQINRDYPDSPHAPSWFDPTYAGETWDNDY